MVLAEAVQPVLQVEAWAYRTEMKNMVAQETLVDPEEQELDGEHFRTSRLFLPGAQVVLPLGSTVRSVEGMEVEARGLT